MLFYIHHNNKEYTVRVESRDNSLHVSFEGRKEEPVDLVFLGHDCTFVRNNKVFQANVGGSKTDYRVWLPDGMLSFEVESEYKRIVSQLRGQNLEEEHKVIAKMPGKIVKVQVKKGDTVKVGDPILIMEAMKMENEILASMAGTVVNVDVKEGDTVESGAALVELEPSSD